jgi:hypothetical protein
VINKDKSFAFRKRFADLFKEEKDVDFRKSQACHELRKEFPAGEKGDIQFVDWFEQEFGLTILQGREMLNRATTFAVVKDEPTWKQLGGYKAIRAVEELPKKQQIEVIEVCKATAKAPRTVMRERNYGSYKPAPAPIVPINAPKTPAPADVRAISTDAKIMAAYILEHCPNAPKNLVRIAERYAAVIAASAASSKRAA